MRIISAIIEELMCAAAIIICSRDYIGRIIMPDIIRMLGIAYICAICFSVIIEMAVDKKYCVNIEEKAQASIKKRLKYFIFDCCIFFIVFCFALYFGRIPWPFWRRVFYSLLATFFHLGYKLGSYLALILFPIE